MLSHRIMRNVKNQLIFSRVSHDLILPAYSGPDGLDFNFHYFISSWWRTTGLIFNSIIGITRIQLNDTKVKSLLK